MRENRTEWLSFSLISEIPSGNPHRTKLKAFPLPVGGVGGGRAECLLIYIFVLMTMKNPDYNLLYLACGHPSGRK
jgi:hypothetical protein